MMVEFEVQYLSCELLSGKAKRAFRFRIEEGHTAPRIGDKDGFRGLVGDALHEVQLIPQAFLRLAALADIADNALQKSLPADGNPP